MPPVTSGAIIAFIVHHTFMLQSHAVRQRVDHATTTVRSRKENVAGSLPSNHRVGDCVLTLY